MQSHFDQYRYFVIMRTQTVVSVYFTNRKIVDLKFQGHRYRSKTKYYIF